MLDYTKVESRLKSFLKNNKRLGYSVALLVTFLINMKKKLKKLTIAKMNLKLKSNSKEIKINSRMILKPSFVVLEYQK